MSDDPLVEIMTKGAVNALRFRARELRRKAQEGVATKAGIRIVSSQAAHRFRIADDWDRIAWEMEVSG